MKKSFRSFLCLFLILGCLLCLYACGGESGKSAEAGSTVKQSATGRYAIESISWDDGGEASGDMLKEQLAIMGETFVELYSDHTALLCLYGVRSDMEYSDSKMWNATNNAISYEFFVKDGKVTLKGQGTTYIFVKK